MGDIFEQSLVIQGKLDQTIFGCLSFIKTKLATNQPPVPQADIESRGGDKCNEENMIGVGFIDEFDEILDKGIYQAIILIGGICDSLSGRNGPDSVMSDFPSTFQNISKSNDSGRSIPTVIPNISKSNYSFLSNFPSLLQNIANIANVAYDPQFSNHPTILQNISKSNDSQVRIPLEYSDNSRNLPEEKSCFRPSYPLQKL